MKQFERENIRIEVIRILLNQDWIPQTSLRKKLDTSKSELSKILWGVDEAQGLNDVLEKKEWAILKDYIPEFKDKGYKGHILRLKKDIEPRKKIVEKYPLLIPRLMYDDYTINLLMKSNPFKILPPERKEYEGIRPFFKKALRTSPTLFHTCLMGYQSRVQALLHSSGEFDRDIETSNNSEGGPVHPWKGLEVLVRTCLITDLLLGNDGHKSDCQNSITNLWKEIRQIESLAEVMWRLRDSETVDPAKGINELQDLLLLQEEDEIRTLILWEYMWVLEREEKIMRQTMRQTEKIHADIKKKVSQKL